MGLGSSGEGFLCDLLSLLGYPNGAGRALLDGTLKLKYQTLFCSQEALLEASYTWPCGPTVGHVADLLTTGGEDVGLVEVEPGGGPRWGMVFFSEEFQKGPTYQENPTPNG